MGELGDEGGWDAADVWGRLVNNAGRLATAGDYELSGDGIELLAQVK